MKLLVLLLAFQCAVAQISLGVGVEVSDDEGYTWLEKSVRHEIRIDKTMFLTQLRLEYKRFMLVSDTRIYAGLDGLTFSPSLAVFDTELRYKINDLFKIGLAHRCVHPILSEWYNQERLYGGYTTKLKLHYNIQ